MSAILAYLALCIAVAALFAWALCKASAAHSNATAELIEAYADELIEHHTARAKLSATRPYGDVAALQAVQKLKDNAL